jgi:outer membrane protein TolC
MMRSVRRGSLRWVLALGLLLPELARAERPVTYAEALDAAGRQAPSYVRGQLARDQAEAGVTIATGIYDPIFGANARWYSGQDRNFLAGSPYDADSSSWSAGTSLTGQLGFGTSYSASYQMAYDFGTFKAEVENPLTGEISILERSNENYRSTAALSLTQQILQGSRLSYNLQQITQARKTRDAAQLTAESARQQAIADAASAYWTWVYAQRITEILEESVKVAEEALRVGTLRVQAGDLAPVERTRLEAALVQSQSDLLAAQVTERSAADALLLLMGETPGQDVLAATDPGTVTDLQIDVTKATEVALAQNPDVQAARVRVEAAESALLAAKHERLPSLSATAAVGVAALEGSAGDSFSNLWDESSLPYTTLSAELALPLRNRAARGGVESAAAQRSLAELEVAELERNVAAQVERQVAELESARRRVELADANVRLAEETLAAEEALARAGRSIQKDVLEARTAADRARAEAFKARTDYRTAVVELLRLQGQIGTTPP